MLLPGQGSLSCEYRVTKYDLTLGLTAGKFLMGDESIRFDINREFGEIEIGFLPSVLAMVFQMEE